MYAAGKIPGGFIKREARPSENAILAARQTDRPIRPLFPEGYKDDVQLVITVLSTDQENNPDVIGTIAASAALTISEIPFNGPIGAVRVGRIDGEFVVNPTHSQLAESDLDLIVAGTRDAIMMVEAGAKLLPEDVMAEAILFGHRALQPLDRPPGGAPGGRRQGRSASPTSSPAPARSSTSWPRPRPSASSSSIDVETTGTRPEDGRPRSRSPPSRSRAARSSIAGRRSSTPARSIVGNQMHGITDKDVDKAPPPPRPLARPLKFVGDAPDRRPQRRLRPRLPRGGPRRRDPLRAGPLPRHARDRPRGLSRTSETYKLGDLSRSSASSSPRATARCPTPRRPRSCCIWFANDLPGRIAELHEAIADAVRAKRHRRRHRQRCSRRPGATRASARACST